MKKNFEKNKGFTFTEAIVSVSIFIFILAALITLYLNYSKTFNFNQITIGLSGSARATANELQSAALQSDQIVASHDFSGQTYSTDSDTLVLELPSIDSSGNIVSDTYDYAVFYLTGNDLYKLVEVNAASSRPSGLKQLSDSVETIALTYNNADVTEADKIDLDLLMQANASEKTVQYSLVQEIYLRNK